MDWIIEAAKVAGVIVVVLVVVGIIANAISPSGRPSQASASRGAGEFHTKVRGVTHRNPRGRKRQTVIDERCNEGGDLELVPEANNPHDPNAVAVFVPGGWTNEGEQIGYLSRDVAAEVRKHLEAGGSASASITDVTGGYGDKPTLGVNILVRLGD